MTNEELCAVYKAGDTAAAATLWEKNKALLAVILRRLCVRYDRRIGAAGMTPEDMEQEGYFIVCEAARRFDPARGAKFSTVLSYAAINRVRAVLGLSTQSGRRAPLCRAASLDEPLQDDEGGDTARGELIPDERAQAAFESVEDRLYTQRLHEDIEATLKEIPAEQAETLRLVYWKGYDRRQLAAHMGCTPEKAKSAEYAALVSVRRKARRLNAYFDDIRTSRAYQGVGFVAWSRSGSVVERITEQIEELAKHPRPV